MHNKIHNLRGPYTLAHTNFKVSRYYEKPTAERLNNPLPNKPYVEIGAIRKFDNRPWTPQPAIYITEHSISLKKRILTLIGYFIVCFIIGFLLNSI